MAQKVTAMDIRMAAALAGQIENVAQFCRESGISRETFYKFRRRFRDEGIAGLAELSRRPLRCPGRTPVEIEDLIEATLRIRDSLGGSSSTTAKFFLTIQMLNQVQHASS